MSTKNYDSLTADQKVAHAMECVARGVPIPEPLRLFLLEQPGDILARIEAAREDD